MEKKIAIIERDEIICRTLSAVISKMDNIKVSGIFGDVNDFTKRTKKKQDMIILGIDEDEENIHTLQVIRQKYTNAKLLMISKEDDEKLIIQALRNGAHGLITVELNYQHIANAIEILFRGGSYLSPKVINLLVSSYHNTPESPLTKKETEVVKHMANGNSYTEISEIIGVSKNTVKSHLKNIYKKTNVNKKSELIGLMKRNRLL